jgi:hypothetical protein
MNMPLMTIIYAALLIILGVGGYFATGQTSITAMIPAFFGFIVLITGLVALRDNLRKHAMHVAAILSLLAVIGSFSGLTKVPALLGGGDLERPEAVASQAIMALLSLAFLLLCIKSFMDARRSRSTQAAA